MQMEDDGTAWSHIWTEWGVARKGNGLGGVAERAEEWVLLWRDMGAGELILGPSYR